jgi:hypothetical protein
MAKAPHIQQRVKARRDAWRPALLDALSMGATTLDACAATGIGKSTFYDVCAADPAFKKEAARCFGVGTKMLAATARSRTTPEVSRYAAGWLAKNRPDFLELVANRDGEAS